MEPDDIIREVKSLSRTRRICTYYRVDLHIHSPESSDYCGDSQISPYEFISTFASREFDLIAITDHNTGAYIDQAIAARKQLAESEGKTLLYCPGLNSPSRQEFICLRSFRMADLRPFQICSLV